MELVVASSLGYLALLSPLPPPSPSQFLSTASKAFIVGALLHPSLKTANASRAVEGRILDNDKNRACKLLLRSLTKAHGSAKNQRLNVPF